ncbi:MAG: nuclear transport factor 2 family protein [Nitrosopumilaceae archaeon]
MNHDAFKSWLDLYSTAWKTRDPKLIKKLFIKGAKYHEKPFESPISGIGSITEYWSVIAQTQENIQFDYNILAVDKNQGIAHWSASFVRKLTKTQVKLDGIFVVNLNSENKCAIFREWWHSYKSKQL